jgi:hypothetical protein
VRGQDLAARVGHLFGAVRHPGTGEPYADAEVVPNRGPMERSAAIVSS